MNGEYRKSMNHELCELYYDVELGTHVKIQRLRWSGHVVRMDEQAAARRVFKEEDHLRVGESW